MAASSSSTSDSGKAAGGDQFDEFVLPAVSAASASPDLLSFRRVSLVRASSFGGEASEAGTVDGESVGGGDDFCGVFLSAGS